MCPASWNARSLVSTTQWPRWMSGLVGSTPSFSRSGPAARELLGEPAAGSTSTAPRSGLSRLKRSGATHGANARLRARLKRGSPPLFQRDPRHSARAVGLPPRRPPRRFAARSGTRGPARQPRRSKTWTPDPTTTPRTATRPNRVAGDACAPPRSAARRRPAPGTQARACRRARIARAREAARR